MASKKDMAALFGNVGKQIEESRAQEPAKEEKKPEVKETPKAKAPAVKKTEEKKTQPVKETEETTVQEKEEKVPEVKEEVKETKPKTEGKPVEKPKRGRPKSEDTIVKRRMTLDLDEQAVDDVNKIIRILYDSKDKMSLTKVIEMSLRDFVSKHQKELDAYNSFRK